MDIVMILQQEFPGAEWSLSGQNYDGLEWMDDSKKPTEAELKKLWPKVQTNVAANEISFLKRSAYQEQADPIFFKWQAGLATEAEWKAARAAVDAQFSDSK